MAAMTADKMVVYLVVQKAESMVDSKAVSLVVLTAVYLVVSLAD